MTARRPLRPAVFLDRDGTLNVDHNFVHKAEEWEWIPGALEAIKGFNRLGFAVVVVSNQSGIGRGLFTSADVEKLHRWVADEAAKKAARIDGFYFCPHKPDEGCACRKPNPGMLIQARDEMGLDLSRSFMAGDKGLDAGAAIAAGVSPFGLLTGQGRARRDEFPAGVPVMEDLPAVLAHIEKTLSREA
jgi:D-glycero-D-manno-heptose 1,7-bisphosphate phosphatase